MKKLDDIIKNWPPGITSFPMLVSLPGTPLPLACSDVIPLRTPHQRTSFWSGKVGQSPAREACYPISLFTTSLLWSHSHWRCSHANANRLPSCLHGVRRCHVHQYCCFCTCKGSISCHSYFLLLIDGALVIKIILVLLKCNNLLLNKSFLYE